MKLTKDVQVGINLVTMLTNEKSPVKVSSLYESLSTTESFLEQIVNKLKKGGIIQVKRGPNGGIMLHPDKKVSVLDIYVSLKKTIKIKEDRENNDPSLVKIDLPIDVPNEVMTHVKNYLGSVICNR